MSNSIGLIESKGLVALIEAADVILKNSPVTILGIHKLENGLVTLAVSGDSDYVKAAIESGTEAGRRVGEIYASSVVDNPDKQLIELFIDLFPVTKDYESVSKETNPINLISEIKNSEVSDSKFSFVEKKLKTESKREKSKPLQVTKITPVHKIKKNKEQTDNKFASKQDGLSGESTEEKSKEIEVNITKPESTNPLSTIERLRLEALGLQNKSKSKKISVNEIKKHTEVSNPIESIDKKEIDFDAIGKMNVHKLRHYAREFPDFPIKGREISRANRNELVDLFNTIRND